jgi:hypothetical protein
LFILKLSIIRLSKQDSDMSLIVLESLRHIRQCDVSGSGFFYYCHFCKLAISVPENPHFGCNKADLATPVF